MKAKTLLVLVLACALLVGAAVWLGTSRQPVGGDASTVRERLLPGLEAQLDAITRVRILADGAEVLLERTDGEWRMPSRDGWPVDLARLRALLLGLAQAERVEAKTANPELYPRLGVEDVSEGGGSGALVELVAGDTRHAVIVGNPRSGDGHYVRVADQAQSWLVDRALEVERDPTDWLQQELTQVDAQRVERVRIEHAEGDPVDIVARESGPGFELAKLPKGRTPQGDHVAEATAGVLSALRLADVRRDAAADQAEQAWSHARFALRDGIVVDLDFVQADGAVLARFDPSLDEAKAGTFAAAQQAKAAMEHARATQQAGDAEGASDVAGSEDPDLGGQPQATGADAAASEVAAPLAVTDPEADREARLAKLREEVAALEQRLEGWVFTLPPYKAEHLVKPLADYLAPQE